MRDPHTFGNTPAAIALARVLDELPETYKGSVKAISKLLVEARTQTRAILMSRMSVVQARKMVSIIKTHYLNELTQIFQDERDRFAPDFQYKHWSYTFNVFLTDFKQARAVLQTRSPKKVDSRFIVYGPKMRPTSVDKDPTPSECDACETCASINTDQDACSKCRHAK